MLCWSGAVRFIGTLARSIHSRKHPEASMVNAYSRYGLVRLTDEDKIPRGFNPDANTKVEQMHAFFAHLNTKRKWKVSEEDLATADVEHQLNTVLRVARGANVAYHSQYVRQQYRCRAKLRGFTFSTALGEGNKMKKTISNSSFSIRTRDLQAALPRELRGRWPLGDSEWSYGRIQQWLTIVWIRVDPTGNRPRVREMFAFARVVLYRPAARDPLLPQVDIINMKEQGLKFDYLPVRAIHQPVAIGFDPVGYQSKQPHPAFRQSSGRFYMMPLH